ncbi:hypothetical protein JVW17_21105, partial [Vibrio cholerae O1]|uniref:hypothetical protein n=1 Tax=Vibrio cholerae TaxID=666 RepID=UPI001C10D985|nr:hypothetical protein [Vibrio cholerae O1]
WLAKLKKSMWVMILATVSTKTWFGRRSYFLSSRAAILLFTARLSRTTSSYAFWIVTCLNLKSLRLRFVFLL